MRKFWPIVIGCALLAIVGSVPMSRVLISQWTVQVIDQDSQPVQKVRVSESWDNYSLDEHGGGDLYTDAGGRVVFRPKEMRAPLAYWIFRPVVTRIEYGVHASSGTFGTVHVSDLFKAGNAEGKACQNERECTAGPLVSFLRISLHSN
jgi:hypothetical protein